MLSAITTKRLSSGGPEPTLSDLQRNALKIQVFYDTLSYEKLLEYPAYKACIYTMSLSITKYTCITLKLYVTSCSNCIGDIYIIISHRLSQKFKATITEATGSGLKTILYNHLATQTFEHESSVMYKSTQ